MKREKVIALIAGAVLLIAICVDFVRRQETSLVVATGQVSQPSAPQLEESAEVETGSATIHVRPSLSEHIAAVEAAELPGYVVQWLGDRDLRADIENISFLNSVRPSEYTFTIALSGTQRQSLRIDGLRGRAGARRASGWTTTITPDNINDFPFVIRVENVPVILPARDNLLGVVLDEQVLLYDTEKEFTQVGLLDFAPVLENNRRLFPHYLLELPAGYLLMFNSDINSGAGGAIAFYNSQLQLENVFFDWWPRDISYGRNPITYWSNGDIRMLMTGEVVSSSIHHRTYHPSIHLLETEEGKVQSLRTMTPILDGISNPEQPEIRLMLFSDSIRDTNMNIEYLAFYEVNGQIQRPFLTNQIIGERQDIPLRFLHFTLTGHNWQTDNVIDDPFILSANLPEQVIDVEFPFSCSALHFDFANKTVQFSTDYNASILRTGSIMDVTDDRRFELREIHRRSTHEGGWYDLAIYDRHTGHVDDMGLLGKDVSVNFIDNNTAFIRTLREVFLYNLETRERRKLNIDIAPLRPGFLIHAAARNDRTEEIVLLTTLYSHNDVIVENNDINYGIGGSWDGPYYLSFFNTQGELVRTLRTDIGSFSRWLGSNNVPRLEWQDDLVHISRAGSLYGSVFNLNLFNHPGYRSGRAIVTEEKLKKQIDLRVRDWEVFAPAQAYTDEMPFVYFGSRFDLFLSGGSFDNEYAPILFLYLSEKLAQSSTRYRFPYDADSGVGIIASTGRHTAAVFHYIRTEPAFSGTISDGNITRRSYSYTGRRSQSLPTDAQVHKISSIPASETSRIIIALADDRLLFALRDYLEDDLFFFNSNVFDSIPSAFALEQIGRDNIAQLAFNPAVFGELDWTSREDSLLLTRNGDLFAMLSFDVEKGRLVFALE